MSKVFSKSKEEAKLARAAAMERDRDGMEAEEFEDEYMALDR